MEREKLTLITVARGALPELFARELKRVLENIDDPNTERDADREINIKVKIRPMKGSDDQLTTKASITSKVAGFKSIVGSVFMGREDGEMVAVSFDPKQFDAIDESRSAVHPIAPRLRQGEGA